MQQMPGKRIHICTYKYTHLRVHTVTPYCNLTKQFVSVLQSTVAPVDGRLRRCVPSLPALKPDRLKTAKTLVEKAVKVIIMYKPGFTVTPLYSHPLSSHVLACVPCDSLSPSSTQIQLRKVFSVQGPYPVIRAALWARGWVERRLPRSAQRAPHCHGDEEEDDDDGDVRADVTGETELPNLIFIFKKPGAVFMGPKWVLRGSVRPCIQYYLLVHSVI